MKANDYKVGDWVYAGDWCYGRIVYLNDEEVHVEYETAGGGGCAPFERDQISPAPAPVNFNEALAVALNRAGRLKGVRYEEDCGIVVGGKSMDDYLVVLYLSQLLENGQAEIKIAPSKCDYMFKLLHIKEGLE